MKNLQEYINESLLDNLDDIDNPSDLRQVIENWIKKNYSFKNLDISKTPNKDGKFEVSSDTVIVADGNDSIPSLTNGMFIWKKVKSFNCSYCDNLTTLEGVSQKIGGSIYCHQRNDLKSYELPKGTKIKGIIHK